MIWRIGKSLPKCASDVKVLSRRCVRNRRSLSQNLWTFLVVKVGNIWAVSAFGSQPLCASANVAILKRGREKQDLIYCRICGCAMKVQDICYHLRNLYAVTSMTFLLYLRVVFSLVKITKTSIVFCRNRLLSVTTFLTSLRGISNTSSRDTNR